MNNKQFLLTFAFSLLSLPQGRRVSDTYGADAQEVDLLEQDEERGATVL